MDESKIEHLKGLIVINLTKYIMDKFSLSHEEAYKKLLASETYKILMNSNSLLYLETDAYLTQAINLEFTASKQKMLDYICLE